ncbi:hypothetical protein NDU88_005452 [Pleurodeles waltl]|uniref:Uncharacterized protein n=1 Tax=Pleurodeles waltl TaxID=8319 RepID=A0AAV7TUV1_PLEWA|nr:hypothetical protein NDU88_005452 [Pleurodeles waltl]
MATSGRVLEALRVLQEEGREDLLQEGVLVQEGMDLKRLRRASSEGVVAAAIACSSPVSGNKYKQKSVMGRRYGQAVAECEELEGFTCAGLPVVCPGSRRGGSRLGRRAGASLRLRVASLGRGAAERSAVASVGHVGAEELVTAHAPAPKKKAARVREQAPLSS